MQNHSYRIALFGNTYEGRLAIDGAFATETVSQVLADGSLEQFYDATFDTAGLGSANRDEYVRVMTRSVLGARDRANRLGISLTETLAGETEPKVA